MRPEALHSSASLKRIHWILFNCADYNCEISQHTCGAAAKIIVSLLIGPEAASNLPNQTAPYPDVPASHTFAGVISYCKTAKIISGYGDGTFKPGNSLTGFAFAKMLLGALGYNGEIEGFVDTGWTMNVARIGHEVGLFDRLDFDGAGAVNRETACQLALNTLKATMVTYGGNTMVSGAQTLVVKGTQAMYVTSNNREINANINRRVINAANNEMTLEFGEAKFKDLRLEHDKYDPAYDDFGHPSNEWSYKKVTIGTFKLPADRTYTTQVSHLEDTVATKEKALDLRGYDTYSTDHRANYTNWSSAAGGTYAYNSPFADATQVTINGWNARVHNTSYTQSMAPSGTKNGNLYSYDAGSSKVTKTSAPTLSEIADLTDNGVTVEVYVCPVDADFITNVVVTRTQLMKVKRIGSDYVTLEDIEPDSRDPRKDGDLAKITGYNAFAVDYPVIDVKDSNYDAYNALKDLKAGDRVAVVPFTPDDGKTWEVGEAYVPETVSGAFTKVDTYANVNKREGSAVAITVGGTSYPINEWNLDMLDVTGNKIKATKKDVTLYLAKDGTVLWADEIGNSDAWMVVGDYYQATGTNGKVGWFVHGWTIGGAEVDLDLGTIRGDAERYAPGELVHYYIAEDGNGEYALEKPNYNGYNHFKDGTIANESARAKRSDGEGIYEVSQYTIDDENKGLATKYAIKSRNGALALENYGTDGENAPLERNTSSAPNPDDPAKKHVNKTNVTNSDGVAAGEVPHDFKYSNLLYDGVKFIFVNFDAANGEVETIDFKNGVQNVDYTDLVRYNNTWKNIGTNDGQKFVLSAAEAYVNNKGVVKAVVVKADSSEADLSKIAVITDTPGDKNLNKGAEGDRVNGLSYAKQYVTGPNFNMSEEKTGYFDKDYKIGTILVISEKDDIIVGKNFHSTYYNNGNPDGVFVKGITPLVRPNGGNSEAGFLIGQGENHGVYTLNMLNKLEETGNTDSLVPDGSKTVDLLTNKYVSGFDTNVNGELKGLVRVDSTTKFIDLRAINNDTIDSLGDLLDYDLDTVELRVLVDGATSTDLFRHAYVVIVEKAVGKKDNVATPIVTIKAAGTTVNETTKKNEATVGSQVVLTADAKNILSSGTTYQWFQVVNGIELPISGATTPVYVVNSVVLGDTTYRVKVTNTDNDKKDSKVQSATADFTITGVSQPTAPATATVKFAGDVTTMDGTGIGASGAMVDSTGKVLINLNLTAPDFVKQDDATTTNNSGVKVEANVSVNGVAVGSFTGATALSGNVANTGIVAISDNSIANMTPGSSVEVVITKVTYDTVMVQYVDAKGTDITSKMVTAGSDASTSTTAATITVKYPSTDAVNFPVISVVSGLTKTGTITQPTSLTGGVTADGSIAGYEIKGTEEVVIKIDAAKVTPSFALSLGDDVKAAATALSTYGVTGTTDGAETVTVTLGANATGMTASSVCTVTVSAAALTEAYKYAAKITLDNGQTYTEACDVNGTNPLAVFSVKNITADTKITKLEIIETPKLTTKLALNDAKNMLTLTFNTPVDPSTVTLTNIGITAGTQTTGTTVDVVKVEVAADGMSATVTVADGKTFCGSITLTANIKAPVPDEANVNTSTAAFDTGVTHT